MAAEPWAILDDAIEGAITGILRRCRLAGGDRDDFCQDARLHFWKRRPALMKSFEGRAALHTYLYRVAWRFFLDRQRRLRTQIASPADLLRASDPRDVLDRLSVEACGEDECCSAFVARTLRAVLERLEGPSAWLLRSHFVDGRSMPAIARDLNVPVQRLYTRLGTILRRLKRQLEDRHCDGPAVRHALERGALADFIAVEGALATMSDAEAIASLRRELRTRASRQKSRRTEEQKNRRTEEHRGSAITTHNSQLATHNWN